MILIALIFSCSSSAEESIAIGKWHTVIEYSAAKDVKSFSRKEKAAIEKGLIRPFIALLLDSKSDGMKKFYNPDYPFSYLPWAMPVEIKGEAARLCFNQMIYDIYLSKIYSRTIVDLVQSEVVRIVIEKNDLFASPVITPYQIKFFLKKGILMHLHCFYSKKNSLYFIVGFSIEKNGAQYTNSSFGKKLMEILRKKVN
jgi:hypothetical protein